MTLSDHDQRLLDQRSGAEMDRAAQLRAESSVRAGPLRGQAAYEASLAACPTYHDGSPRPAWEKLCTVARQSWEKA